MHDMLPSLLGDVVDIKFNFKPDFVVLPLYTRASSFYIQQNLINSK